MLGHALGASRSTGGLVTPTVGAAVVAAGYDDDFGRLPADGPPVRPARVPPPGSLSLRGRLLVRAEPIELDLNCVVKGATVDDALALVGGGFVAAGGDVATSAPLVVGLPGGGSVTLHAGGLATSSVTNRRWRRGGEAQHHLIDPSTGRPARVPWLHVTVAAGSCLAADVAAKAALLLGPAGPFVARPPRAARAASSTRRRRAPERDLAPRRCRRRLTSRMNGVDLVFGAVGRDRGVRAALELGDRSGC